MQFFKLFSLGLTNYWKGLKFLLKHKLYWYVLFPIALFVGIYWLGGYFESMEWSLSRDIKKNILEIDTINGLIWKTTRIIFFDQLYYMFTKFTMYFVIMCLAPVLAIVSEKIEEIITGNVYKWNFLQIIKDIKRAAILNIRLILIEYLIILVLFGIGTLIGGNTKYVLTYVIPILIGFYFYGFGYIDYILERRRLNIQQSVHFVSKHKGLAVALGLVFSSCFLSFDYLWRKFSVMPIDTTSQILWGTLLVVLFILAVSAPILAIASSTLSMHEVLDLSSNEYAVQKKKAGTAEAEKNEDVKNDETAN